MTRANAKTQYKLAIHFLMFNTICCQTTTIVINQSYRGSEKNYDSSITGNCLDLSEIYSEIYSYKFVFSKRTFLRTTYAYLGHICKHL